MKIFVFSASLVYALLLTISALMEEKFFMQFGRQSALFTVALAILIIPAAATWLAAELTQASFHKRLFDRRVHCSVTRAILGAIAGTLGVLLSIVMLVVLDRALPDVLLTGVAAAASTALVLVPQRRLKPGVCVHCAYELSGVVGSSVCPECGKDVMRA